MQNGGGIEKYHHPTEPPGNILGSRSGDRQESGRNKHDLIRKCYTFIRMCGFVSSVGKQLFRAISSIKKSRRQTRGHCAPPVDIVFGIRSFERFMPETGGYVGLGKNITDSRLKYRYAYGEEARKREMGLRGWISGSWCLWKCWG